MNDRLTAIKQYYDKVEKFYLNYWGPDPHFGIFEYTWMMDAAKIDDAIKAYTSQLVQKGLSLLPQHWRDQNLIVLDLCCGRGPIYFELQEIGVQGDYVGIDITLAHINEFSYRLNAPLERRRLHPHVFCADVESSLTAIENNKCFHGCVDMVFCEDSLYHLSDKKKVVNDIAKLLRPGGILVVSDFAVEQIFSGYEEWQKHFCERQANSSPLIFSVDQMASNYLGCKEYDCGARRWKIFKRNKRRPCFEFERILSDGGFFVPKFKDRTKDMCMTYEKVLSKMDSMGETTLCIDGMAKDMVQKAKEAFIFLKQAGKAKNLRLLWWFAVKREKAESYSCRDDSFLASIEIKSPGFRYRSSKSKKEIMVLREMTLSINRGDYIVIGGQNGSGKSTLLQLVAGLLKDSRVVQLKLNDGVRIAYVEQTPSLFEDLTVEKAVRLVLKSVQRWESQQKLNERILNLMSQCNVSELTSKISELSGGQRQRAAVVLALAALPDILLLDEPTSAQDAFSRKKMLLLFDQINRNASGPAIVHVTHRFDEIEKAMERHFFELNAGQLLPMKKADSHTSKISKKLSSIVESLQAM